MKDIKLYINGKLADLPQGISLPMTYSVEDLKNPTVVKNSYSKSISLPNTKNNALLFDEIWRLDRLQKNNTFDPSKRVDFALYDNGDLLESGYVQLNNVTGVGEEIAYNITLYGGLGDFFYNLKYNEDGEKRYLYDLDFGLRPQDPTREFDTTLDASLVQNCFDKDWSEEDSDITDIITFVPEYNGLYDNFSSDTALINLPSQSVFPRSKTVTEEGEEPITYTGYNGYALAKLEKDYTEWEMKELRSSRQRPAIKVSKLIEAICDNSGYEVEYDPTFFNDLNPYWNKTFLTLPKLTPSEQDEQYSEANGIGTKLKDVYVGERSYSGTAYSLNSTLFNVTSPVLDEKRIRSTNGVIDLSDYPLTSKLSANIDFSLMFYRVGGDDGDNIYISSKKMKWNGRNPYQKYYLSSILAQAIAYDENDNMIAYSDIYNFTNPIAIATTTGESYSPGTKPATQYTSGPELWGSSYVNDTPNANYVNVLGNFKRVSGNQYAFTTSGNRREGSGGDNTFVLQIPNIPFNTTVKVKLRLKKVNVAWENDDDYRNFFTSAIMPFDTYQNYIVRGWANAETVDKPMLTVEYDPVVTTGSLITKKMLLSGDVTPADMLLSYCKLFGLYFVKDKMKKKVYIMSRNTFFKNNIVDLTEKIDRSMDFTIEPIIFDKKWYQLNLETPDTYYSSKYNHSYNQVYGQQRVDTGYNFNSDKTLVYNDSVIKATIPAQNSSQYYRNFFKSNNVSAPGFLNDTCTFTLYNGLDDTNDQTLDAKLINKALTRPWNLSKPGVDYFPKQCMYSGDNSPVDIDYSLVFYNGMVSVPYNLWLTNDVAEMAALNDNEQCYLWTNSEYNGNGDRIAYLRNSYPSYVSFINNPEDYRIGTSLDFGVPQEIYLDDDFSYRDDATLYYKFWKALYNDQYNVNTKKCVCYVRLDEVNNDTMRKLYFFEEAYWFLNKIDSFDVASLGTTRCEFIKIQDKDNYLNGVPDYSEIIKTISGTIFPKSAGNYTLQIYSPFAWEITDFETETMTPTSGSGYTTLVFQLGENSRSSYKTYTISFKTLEGLTFELTIAQSGSLSSDIVLSPSSGYNSLPYRSASNTIYVVCSGSWTLSTTKDWIHPSITEGFGSQTVSVTFDNNETNEDRSGILTGTSRNFSSSLTFTQRSNAPKITITPTTIAAAANGGTYSFVGNYLNNDGDTTTSTVSDSSWIRVDSYNPTTLRGTFTVSANTTQVTRTGYVYINGVNNRVSGVCRITQLPAIVVGSSPRINQNACVECGSCWNMMAVCPVGCSISLTPRPILNLDNCIACGTCGDNINCPAGAITMVSTVPNNE